MNARELKYLLGLISAAVLLLYAAPADAALKRLFPDVALRFPVGDPLAENPIADTEGPKTLAGADLDGDGLADVIAGNLDGSISVLLGRTNHVLAPQILIPATGLLSNSSFRAVVVADFNNDGRTDVAAGDISGEGIVVLLGNGTGALLPHRRTGLGPVRAMAAADFNHDGKTDLLVACSPAECNWCGPNLSTNASLPFLCTLNGNGDGTFEPPRYLLTPGIPACFYDVEAADMDGDGHTDAVALDFSICYYNPTVARSRRVQIFTNDGEGHFATNAPARVLEAAGEGPRAIEIGYLDELVLDGNVPPGATLDLVVVNRDSGTLDIFLNNGGLDFTNADSVTAGKGPRDAAIGDLNGDGFADLVVVSRSENNIAVAPGLGGGRFGPPVIEYPTGVSPRQIVLADLDGDGVLDAAVNNRVSEDISIFPGKRGLAGFLLPGNYYPEGVTPLSVVAVDFNHDGYPDVAVANVRSHDVRVRFNRGNGSFGDETIYRVNNGPAILVSGDLNGDGNPDLLVSCLGSGNYSSAALAGGSLVALLGRNDGTFQEPLASGLGSSAGSRPFWLRLGDLDNDGVLDAVVGGLSGELIALRGLGTGAFSEGVPLAFAPSGRPLGVTLGDFDGNGKLDIATSRGITVLNDGQFFNELSRPIPARTLTFTAGTQAWAIESEDLDSDGILDLTIALTFVRPDPIGVLFGRGDGTFTEPTIYEGPDVGVVALAGTDMDGDGIKDIVVGNRCAATVIILGGLGNRRFEYREIIRAYSVEDVAVADLNQDGKPDIVGVGIGLWPIINGSESTLAVPRTTSIYGLPERTGLFINELMAQNTKFHVTNSATPDWVELYNHSTATQNLAGWSLAQINADGEVNPWTFPATGAVVAPFGHLVVYCKKNPGTNLGLYATFELSADGENLSLHRPDGAQEDAVVFPPMPSDVSYARFLDGSRSFAYNPAPTIGKPNRKPANLDPSADRKDPYVGPGASALGVNARFFDDIGIAYAGVVFRPVGSNTAWQEMTLSDDGLHGDKLAGDGYWGALLPSMPPGTSVEYYLRVVDLEGESGSSPNDLGDLSNLHRVVVPSRSALRLTELVAANNSGLQDERGQFEDWVEISNTGDKPASLDGLVLSRDYYERGNAWYFPSNHSVPPGQRIIVFCDDDAGDGPLHANFKLSRSGDRVFLLDAATWTVLDSLSFGPLPDNTSFGVVDDGIAAQWLAFPTPGSSNLPMPPVTLPGGNPQVFWHMTDGSDGPKSLFLRWRGGTNSTFRVDASSNLVSWEPTIAGPVNLGEGLFQWSAVAAPAPHFYRVVQLP
jgi:hypothetical protein